MTTAATLSVLTTHLLRTECGLATPRLSFAGAALSGLVLGPLAALASFPSPPATVLLGSAVAGLLTSLLCTLALLIPESWRQDNHRRQFWLLGAAGAAGLFGAALLLLFAHRKAGLALVRPTDLLQFLALLGLWFAFVLLFLEHRRLRRRTLDARAKLSALESQIRPHFFFNTINTISALIPEQPELAQQLLGRFAGLFRNLMDTRSGMLVSLTRELDLVRDYLEIEKARFGSRIRYTLPSPVAAEGLTLPSLTLQPLVENAVRHGIAKLIDGGEVSVDLTADAGTYTLTVSNPVEDPPSMDPQVLLNARHSLDMIAGRLQLLYRGRARMWAEYDGRFRMLIRIPRSRSCVP
ncbi:MAG: histidine kinase [Bryobacteraceae bacterium]